MLTVYEILLVLNISAVFYMAFDYIPRLERDVEKSYERIVYLNKIKNKGIEDISPKDVDDAIAANRHLIEAFTRHRVFKIYFPLFLLSIPLLLVPLSLIYPTEIISIETVNRVWSLMLFFGMCIPFITAVGAMIRNRPYTKYENIHHKVFFESDYEN